MLESPRPHHQWYWPSYAYDANTLKLKTTPLLEIQRDFRRRRAEYETSKREMLLTIQHISPNDVRAVKD
jgi:hypothetical protein